MKEDTELLRNFAENGDEAAFRALVDRHVNLVHSVAMRQVNGDAHLAADVTQVVFTDMARKAAALSRYRVLAGWLFTSTRYAAAKLIRREQRRRRREQEAYMRQDLSMNSGTELEWEQVRGVLDDALDALSTGDREAILMRYFESRGFGEIGGKLNLSDNTARMRVERALDKLRVQLERRGVKSTSAALAAAMTGGAVTAAPAGLGASVATTALSAAAAAGSGAVIFMGMTKLQLGITSALALAGTALITVQAKSNDELRSELVSAQTQSATMATSRAQNVELKRTAAEVAELRRDDAEFARVRDEAAALRRRVVASNEKKGPAAPPVVGGPDRLAQLRTPGKPLYPDALLKSGVSGTVVIDFIVDAQGEVQNAAAVKSSEQGFDAAAIEAVRQSVFDSGVKGGRPVNVHMQIEAVFNAATGEASLRKPEPVAASEAAKWL